MIQCQRLFPLAVLVTSCFISCLLADSSVKGQTKRTVRSLRSNTLSADEDGLVASMDAKTQDSDNSSPRFRSFAEGELFDKQPIDGQDGGAALSRGDEVYGPDFADSLQKPAISKRFNEFVGKRSSPTEPGLDNEMGDSPQLYKGSNGQVRGINGKQDGVKKILLRNLLRKYLQAEDATKRQYEFVGKRPYDFLGKRYDFIGKRYDFIGKRYDFLGKRSPYDFIGKKSYDFLGKRSAVDENSEMQHDEDGNSAHESEAEIKRYSEFLGRRKRTQEEGSAAMSDRAMLAALLQDNRLRKRISEMLMRQRLAVDHVPEFVGK